MAAHALHMTGVDGLKKMFAAVTENGAKVLGLEGYGLKPGCNADMVILQAANELEALRLRPARLWVIRRGKVISRTSEVLASVDLGAGEELVDFT